MEEQKTIERPLMSEEEFKDYMKNNRVDVVGDFYERGILHLRTYEAGLSLWEGQSEGVMYLLMDLFILRDLLTMLSMVRIV